MRPCALSFVTIIWTVTALTGAKSTGVEDLLGFDLDGVTVTMTQEQIEERLTIAGFQFTHYFQDSHNAEYEERHYRKKIEGSSERIFLVKAWDGLTEEIELHIKSEFDSNEKRRMLLDVLGEPTGSCPYDKQIPLFHCAWTRGVLGSRVTVRADLREQDQRYIVERDIPK